MTDDPQAIAARLSPAQRRAMLWLNEDGSGRSPYLSPKPYPSMATLTSLQRHSPSRPPLAVRYNARTSHLTFGTNNLGLAVRAILAKEPAHDR